MREQSSVHWFWEDQNFDAVLTSIGANAPSTVNWNTTTIKIPTFPHTQTKELNLLKEYAHAGKSGSDLKFHTHVYPETNGAGTIKLYLEVNIHTDTQFYTATLSASVSTNSTAWEKLYLGFPSITGIDVGPGTQIGARLYRLNTDPGTYAAAHAITTWGYHYQRDAHGSKQETRK